MLCFRTEPAVLDPVLDYMESKNALKDKTYEMRMMSHEDTTSINVVWNVQDETTWDFFFYASETDQLC